jgi:hypothetical protein
MSLDMQKLSPHLQEVLLNLKHMSPTQRFAEVSRPRYELNWRTIAGAYGVEKLEKNQWIIPDWEVLQPNPTPLKHGGTEGAEEERSSPLICTDDTDQSRKTNGVAGAALSCGGRLQQRGVLSQAATVEPGVEARVEPAREKKSEAVPLTKEEEDRLASGVDHEYSEAEPDVARERRRSIELAARVRATPYHRENNNRELLRDDELMKPEVRAEVEALGGMEAVPVDEDYVLARDGQVMHRITLQHALEKSIRQQLGVPEPWRADEEKIRWHKEQLARLEKADAAPRCEHIYMDGTRCRAPRLKQERWCYAHERMLAVRAKKLRLLAMEDANSIVVNLMEIGRALCDDEISERKAGLLMYQQQLALIALKGVTFKATDGMLMVRTLPGKTDEIHRGGAETRRETKPIATDKRGRTEMKTDFTAEDAKRAEKKPNGKAEIYHAETEGRRQAKPIVAEGCRGTGEAQTRVSVPHGSGSAKTPQPRAAALQNQEKIPGDESAKSNGFGVEGGGEGGSHVIAETHPSCHTNSSTASRGIDQVHGSFLPDAASQKAQL